MTLLGITRSSDELRSISTRATSQGVEVVAIPLVKHTHVDFDLPGANPLAEGDWLLFTSARGVEAFFTGLKKSERELPRKIRIATVGKSTRSAVERFGFQVSFVPGAVGAFALFEEFVKRYEHSSPRVIYLSAKEAHFDPSDLLKPTQINYTRIVTYRSEVAALSENPTKRFTSSDCILFTSPLTVSAFAEQFSEPESRILALGPSTASAITKIGWGDSETLPEPNIELALQYSGSSLTAGRIS
ncbi:MAG: uroporphyrinogen-III synthase [candidate division Zixibacteria bacterium]|nr:uroporphyrinogen-III synthase [candidate division Zixibacteria bacterium]